MSDMNTKFVKSPDENLLEQFGYKISELPLSRQELIDALAQNDIPEKVRRFMALVLCVDVSQLTDELSVGDIESWDWLKHAVLVAAIQKMFGFECPRSELADVESVRDVVDLVTHYVTRIAEI